MASCNNLKLLTFINFLFSIFNYLLKLNTSRRSFIKTSSPGTLGLGFLPAFTRINNILGVDLPFNFPRASPESQGISSKAIRNFIKAANDSGIGWHSFILAMHGNIVAEGWWKPFAPEYK